MTAEFNASATYEEWPLVNARTCFYMLLPHETYFKTVADVPPLTARAILPGTLMMVFEFIVLYLIGKKEEWRLHSAIVSWSSTALYEAFSMFLFRGVELTLYQWVFDHFRLVTLPWDSIGTFFFSLITVEFCGYWWHRMGHELAIMWASHELHHSSDDFNFAVAFRNSAPMRLFRWVFYIPLAFLGVPTSTMFTHLVLGSIYNGFIHQHAVPKLGSVIPGLGHVLEYIFVTPSHHRVHHASNKYCIDKNYGQYLIIWDRLFGTFVEEKEDESLTYGSLTQPMSYDMAALQFSSFAKLWQKFNSMDNFGDKMRTLFYGPGWFPGTPRLGNPDDIPDVRGREKYSPKYPLWVSFYLVLNAFCVFYSYLNMATRLKEVSQLVQFLNLVYVFIGFAAIGGLYDKQKYSPGLELGRILLIFGLSSSFPMLSPSTATTVVTFIHYADLFVWPYILQYIYSVKKDKNDEIVSQNKNDIDNTELNKKEVSTNSVLQTNDKLNTSQRKSSTEEISNRSI